jgi:hypothetical protein
LVECAGPDVNPRLSDPHSSSSEVDVAPTQPGDFAASQAREGEMPGMPVAVLRDTAQKCSHLIAVKFSNFFALPGTRSISAATFLAKRPSATICARTCDSAPSM